MSEVELVKQLNARANMTERLTGVKGDGTRLRDAADTITRLLKERDEWRSAAANSSANEAAAEAQVTALRGAIGKKLTPKARELLGDLAESMTMMREEEGQPLTLLLQWYDESRKALEASR